ncbi:MAG: galactose-1-phosphate uridylyltransferase [Tenericutes bacterium HGW-Tenericutes-5]|jgi:UDPglucose--hexose-1-phosphate uridylyltransferase|nr:MAG: galactose-1-phosphate uridylyltransferase [Tenericutes bacterium HGW-Tenericutes-5]
MINKYINQLIKYGINNHFLEEDDIYYAVNRILKLLDINSFQSIEVEEELDITKIINPIIDYAIANNCLKSSGLASKDAFEAQVIDCLLPRPSEMNRIFYKHYKTGPLTATNWFHDFSIKTNYIKTERIKQNINYKYVGKYAPLDITINLSKPEKDPLDIKLDKNNSTEYPLCPLCIENVGVYQTPSLAPRTNHRVVNLSLNHEKDKWGMQYSPYAYFNEHLIVLRKDHSPMYVNQKTFQELIDFINKFPHYLIGSNAGLPIVGGSILSHHHFQGGRYDFPIEKAQVLQKIKRKRMTIEILDWPLAAIRIIGSNENSILDMANSIFEYWQKYENQDIKILAKTDEEHNTVTPIVKLDGANYNFYMIFRNNLTSKELPLGIFHPNPSRFHIKKENIGLIEAMGMAILPGRLLQELEMIKEVLLNQKNILDYPDLDKHQEWIYYLKSQPLEDLDDLLKKEIGRIFEAVLEDCNVFKYGTKQDFINFVNKAIY